MGQLIQFNPQHAVNHEGLNVDLDIENLTGFLQERDYSDPLLSALFWRVVHTYYRPLSEKIDIETCEMYLPVNRLIEHGEVMLLFQLLPVAYEVIPRRDKKFPPEIADWFEDITHAARVETPFGWTYFQPGVSMAHALTVAVVERARHISKLHLNPELITGIKIG